MSNSQMKDAQVLKPLQSAFEGEHVIGTSILGRGQRFHMFERVEYPPEGGIYVYYKGLPYPKKGFPYPEAIQANDIMKKNIVMMIDIFGRKEMILPIIGFILTPWKFKARVIANAIKRFSSISDWLMSSHRLKEERHSPVVRELYKFTRKFIQNLGIDYGEMVARIVASIIEYDDAYRLRLEDILSETNVFKLWKNPSREISRLALILQDRELSHAKDTFKKFSRMIYLILLVPKIRRAFRNAFIGIDFKKMQLDEADRYHVLLRADYNFMGKTFDERKAMFMDFHKDGKYPPEVIVGE